MTVAYGLGDFVRSVTRFDGSTVSNRYDNAGRLATMTLTDGQNSRTIATSYTTNSLVQSISDGTTVLNYDYNRLNRLTSVSTGSTNSTTSTASYAYDPVGNLTNRTVAIQGGTATLQRAYAYDAANRLTGIASDAETFSLGKRGQPLRMEFTGSD